MAPILTWHVKLKDEETFSPTKNKFIGTHTARENITATIQLWNNRRGTTNVDDLEDFTIRLDFQDEEDSALLKYVLIKDQDDNMIGSQNFGKHILFNLPPNIVISGKANNGVMSENRKNYLEFKLIFQTPNNIQLKENDLKTLYLEVVAR